MFTTPFHAVHNVSQLQGSSQPLLLVVYRQIMTKVVTSKSRARQGLLQNHTVLAKKGEDDDDDDDNQCTSTADDDKPVEQLTRRNEVGSRG